jgi:hypothetical protein
VFCLRHSNEKDRIRGYRLSNPELREQFEHFNSVDLLKTVREEVVILRSMINERLNSIQNQSEMLAAFNIVRPALIDVVKCIEILTKLELKTSVVLGKDALSTLNGKIIKILSGALEGVPDYDRVVDSVARQIASAIAESHNQE